MRCRPGRGRHGGGHVISPAVPLGPSLEDALEEVRRGRDAICNADAVDACLHLWDGGSFAFSVPARTS